ncbi:MAG: ABC transporter permease [Bacteroidota bacterium]
MIKHFIKVFLRTSVRNGAYTFINVSGLAIGLASAILILLWVWDETHFDKQHVLRDRIYQVKSFHKYPGQGNTVADVTSGALAIGMRDLPEVEQSCRLTDDGSRMLMQNGTQAFYELGIFADTTVFNVFTIPIIEGVPFHDDNTIMLSQKLADKYFPGESAVGKALRINAERDVVVSGVFKDLPDASTLKYDFMVPYNVYAKTDQYNNEWGAWTGGYTYVLLHPGTDIKALDLKIKKTFTEPLVWVRWDDNVELFLFPFTDSRLKNSFNEDGLQEGGRIWYVKTFGYVGIFILIVACINFMNLATARSVSRSKEIGVRKVSGAAKWSLIRQFFSESVLLALVALIFALVIVQTLLPSFNTLTHKTLSIDLADPVFVALIFTTTLITGIVAGSYPAFSLSSLKPVAVLKGRFTGIGGKNIRMALVVFQFGLSTSLIVCALAAQQQIRYMKEKDLGFDRDNILYFPASDKLMSQLEAFKTSALENPKIVSVARGSANPMQVFGGIVLNDNAWEGKTKDDNIIFRRLLVDEDYIPTLGFKVLKGRNFSKDNPSDSNNYLLTEEAARQMKLKDPIGAKLLGPQEGTIIGIVNNFNSDKLSLEIQPVIIGMIPKRNPNIFVKYQAGQAQEVLTDLQTLYKSFEPDIPMEYRFMDTPFGEMYENELLIEKLSMYFTIIAIFISCLGLFGLASFTAETRTKEIGVRKVLGASVAQIVTLLGKDFLVLICISLAVGLPLGWWGVSRFLDSYRYHTEISAWLFIGITMLMVGITLISVGYQSAKAAVSNPVKTLRSE